MTVRRKDGRELVTKYPVRPEDYIEVHSGPIPGDVTCAYRSKEPAYEAWMDDI